MKTGSILEKGSGSAMEIGITTFIPFLNIRNYDRSIELAMTRSLQNGLAVLARQLEGL